MRCPKNRDTSFIFGLFCTRCPEKWDTSVTLLHRQVLVDSLGNGEDGLIEEDIRTAEGLPALLGGLAAEELVGVDGAEIADEHLHFVLVIQAQGADGEWLGIAGLAVEDKGLDIGLFLPVVGGVDKAAGFADYFTDGVVDGVSGFQIFSGKIYKLLLHRLVVITDTNVIKIATILYICVNSTKYETNNPCPGASYSHYRHYIRAGTGPSWQSPTSTTILSHTDIQTKSRKASAFSVTFSQTSQPGPDSVSAYTGST